MLAGPQTPASHRLRRRVQLHHQRAALGALGPAVVDGIDPADLLLTTRVNGEVRQQSRTSQLITPVGELLAYISAVMTLEPGDAVFTGTPAGVGPLVDGDVVEVEIEGVGLLRNPVRRAGA